MMEKFTLVIMVKGTLNNAGSKAPLDICRILEESGGVHLIYFILLKLLLQGY